MPEDCFTPFAMTMYTNPLACFFLFIPKASLEEAIDNPFKIKIMNALSLLDSTINVGKNERTQSIITGATFLISAFTDMKNHPKMSIAKSVLGGYLLYRGLSGHCHINQLVNKTTAREF